MIEYEQLQDLVSAAGLDGATEILAAFWRSTEDLVAGLEKPVADSDFEEAARIAHAVKGSASNVGASGLADEARQLETACRDKDAAAVGAVYVRLRDQIGTAKDAYSAYFDMARAKAS
ncbi:MAG: Hpt domain-containing protein [Pseudomonadota bacterium]